MVHSLRRKTRNPALVLIALVSFAAASCANAANGNDSSASDEYKVVVIADQTGDGSAVTLPFAAGIKTYFAESGHDEVAGKKVNIVSTLDSQSTPEGARAKFQQALSANPIAILAYTLSASLGGVAPVMASSDVPVISEGFAPNLLDAGETPWFFTFGPTPAAQMTALVAKASDELGGSLEGKKIAVAAAQTPAFDEFIKVLQSIGDKDGFTVGPVIRNEPEIASFTGPAASIAADKPDAVFQFQTVGHVTVAKALIDAGYTGPILGTVGSSNPATLEAIGSDQFFGLQEAKLVSTAPSVEAKGKELGYDNLMGSAFFSDGYAAGAVLQSALTKCGGGCSPSKLQTALEQMGPVTVPHGLLYGPIQFSAESHEGLTALQFYSWDMASKSATPSGSPITIH